jgi:hypothetical protein
MTSRTPAALRRAATGLPLPRADWRAAGLRLFEVMEEPSEKEDSPDFSLDMAPLPGRPEKRGLSRANRTKAPLGPSSFSAGPLPLHWCFGHAWKGG